MKQLLIPALAALLALIGAAAQAGTVTLTRVDPTRTTATPNEYLNAPIWRSMDGGRWRQVYHGAFYLTDGADRYIAYCLEQYVFVSFPTEREVVTMEDMAAGNFSGVNRLNPDPVFTTPSGERTTLLEDIGRLFDTAAHLAVDGESRAALQLALWELTDDDRNVRTGRFRTWDTSESSASSMAQRFLDNMYGVPTAPTRHQFFVNVVGQTSQLLISAATPTPSLDGSHDVALIPLPLSGLLMVPALGALGLLRRRRTA